MPNNNEIIISSEELERLSVWLKTDGQTEIKRISELESETEKYIKNMSVIDPEQIKAPYTL